MGHHSGEAWNALRHFLCAALLSFVLHLGAVPELAGQAMAQAVQTQSDEGEALLSADAVLHDEEARTITASGNVEIAYGEQVLRADEIIYEIERDVIIAQGNVALVDDDGDVVFADRAEVTADLDEAFVSEVRALLRESNRITAASAVRTEGNRTLFRKARFTPCSHCTYGDKGEPLWYLEADQVTHDQKQRLLRYRNARLNLFGLPVLYTPYFEHPDWTVDRRSE